ncbi:MBL fold metallo-hydrolase [Neolewinella antarctica]|uniref:Glyoxylase-like metal-dependent hydrolase (Beta-lactamase superfamily II) n=1 Tax=Neolewinella antarctica TaxID=442734 RepID=A0ABX0XAM9_9BACT|nr:MBL fold metallo-hydrolase [Neolewinella antarctica]NJC26290.1 glyoxylase-like metal-dependent hydrolase (beta-lactamase superfamily II) [Neolewinella antarctica]
MELSSIENPTTPVTESGAPDVLRIPTAFVNVYAVGDPNVSWVLVDTGLPGFGNYVKRITEAHASSPPAAIILTHGHFDHAGNAIALADEWDVPIYAHPAELPFLTGRSNYAPADSSMGGAIAQLARVFPLTGYDFSARVQPLPEDGSVPGLEGWRWLHTPGHTNGHVSLWRESDRFLIAGDALATMDLDSWLTQITHTREIARAPVPFTPDWDAAEASLSQLAELRPRTLAAGHGQIINDPDLATKLAQYATRSQRPTYGRYARQAPVYDVKLGVISVPEPVVDRSLPWLIGGIGATVFGMVVLKALLSSGKKERNAPPRKNKLVLAGPIDQAIPSPS